VLLIGCENKEETSEEVNKDVLTIDSIVNKIESQAILSDAEQCIVEAVTSSIIDKNNILVYASSFDVLARYSITKAASEINFCRPMIQARSGKDLLSSLSEHCPVRLNELSVKEFNDLHAKAAELTMAAGNFKGSVFEFAYGSCVK